MDVSLLALIISVAVPLIIHLTRKIKNPRTANLPPGSLGMPVIGQSLGLIRAIRSNTAEQWIRNRVDRYGPVSKLSLFGKPTVLVTGPAANKFVFFSGEIGMRQPRSVQRIIGENSILDVNGADHKRIRGTLAEFLSPDMLRMIDGEVRRHIDES
ncbi:hypothetical protein EJB05_12240, partial [Eragrostis curvula]